MGRYRTSQTWRIIALLYSEQEKDVEKEQLDEESIEEAKIVSDSYRKVLFFFLITSSRKRKGNTMKCKTA